MCVLPSGAPAGAVPPSAAGVAAACASRPACSPLLLLLLLPVLTEGVIVTKKDFSMTKHPQVRTRP